MCVAWADQSRRICLGVEWLGWNGRLSRALVAPENASKLKEALGDNSEYRSSIWGCLAAVWLQGGRQWAQQKSRGGLATLKRAI